MFSSLDLGCGLGLVAEEAVFMFALSFFLSGANGGLFLMLLTPLDEEDEVIPFLLLLPLLLPLTPSLTLLLVSPFLFITLQLLLQWLLLMFLFMWFNLLLFSFLSLSLV